MNAQTSSKLSFASLSTISAADSFDSLLVKLHQSHSDFDLTTPSGNFTKTSPELVRPPAPSPRKMNCYDSVNESKLLQKDVNQTLPPQPDVAVNEKQEIIPLMRKLMKPVQEESDQGQRTGEYGDLSLPTHSSLVQLMMMNTRPFFPMKT